MDPKPSTWRSKKYLDFIRSKPCLMCGHYAPSMAHHEGFGSKGMGMKVSDAQTIPLCPVCHSGRHTDARFFYDIPGIDDYAGSDKWIAVVMLRFINEYLCRAEIK